MHHICGLGLACLVSRRSRDIPPSRLGLVSTEGGLGLVSEKFANVSVSGLNVLVSVSGWKVSCTSLSNTAVGSGTPSAKDVLSVIEKLS
jgi:hypothetical protein